MGAPKGTLHLYAAPHDRAAYELRDFLTRAVVRFESVTIATEADADEHLHVPLAEAGLPIVEMPDGSFVREATVEKIGRALGWITAPRLQEYDLSIFGAGPAGLSAAVYAASEGLSVVVVEKDAIGGQAGTSSLIENYLGFPGGIGGADLAERARQQAVAFGAEFIVLREGLGGSFSEHGMRGVLADGTTIEARSNICATGVEWRRLGLDGEDRLLGCGLYYGAGTSEASECAGEDVLVVGGANSAGQAAMNLAAHAASVTMVVRGPSLSATMSSYLAERIAAEPSIRVQYSTRVEGLLGDERFEGAVLEGPDGRAEHAAGRMFVCIGGDPHTDWALPTPIARDAKGYLITGPDLERGHLEGNWTLDRAPYYLETNVPGCFAAGDVRAGSVKRVASAVGEGAMAVTFAHRYLASL
jgi:Thioredoxin reductase